MHDDHRYSQLSSCAHAGNTNKQQLNSLSTADSYIACKDTNSWSRWELHYVEAVFRLGLEFLCEINVQFNKIPVTCVCFL